MMDSWPDVAMYVMYHLQTQKYLFVLDHPEPQNGTEVELESRMYRVVAA